MRVVFAVLHFGDQNITAAVKAHSDADAEEHAAVLNKMREGGAAGGPAGSDSRSRS